MLLIQFNIHSILCDQEVIFHVIDISFVEGIQGCGRNNERVVRLRAVLLIQEML